MPSCPPLISWRRMARVPDLCVSGLMARPWQMAPRRATARRAQVAATPTGAISRHMTTNTADLPASVALLASGEGWLTGELRSDHAGEAGAVMIYRGILAGSRNSDIRQFAASHGVTEQGHLDLLETLLPPRQRSILLPIWRIAGWLTGFLPALVGPTRGLRHDRRGRDIHGPPLSGADRPFAARWTRRRAPCSARRLPGRRGASPRRGAVLDGHTARLNTGAMDADGFRRQQGGGRRGQAHLMAEDGNLLRRRLPGLRARNRVL